MSFNMPQTSAIEGIVEANSEVGGEILYISIFILSIATDWMSFKDVRFMTLFFRVF